MAVKPHDISADASETCQIENVPAILQENGIGLPDRLILPDQNFRSADIDLRAQASFLNQLCLP